MDAARYLPTLSTPRLLIREMQQDDATHLAHYLVQPRYQRYVSHRLKDDHEVLAFVRRTIGAQGDRRRRIYHLVAEEQATGDVCGDGFIILHHDGSHEIGWGVAPTLWHQGYGSEIGRALLALCFERLKAESAWCKVMSENSASAKLALRIGMKLEQTFTDYVVNGNRRETVEFFRLSADEYFELPY
jgi:[ribosomal protein S5]-alanine N-acetyltransferase